MLNKNIALSFYGRIWRAEVLAKCYKSACRLHPYQAREVFRRSSVPGGIRWVGGLGPFPQQKMPNNLWEKNSIVSSSPPPITVYIHARSSDDSFGNYGEFQYLPIVTRVHSRKEVLKLGKRAKKWKRAMRMREWTLFRNSPPRRETATQDGIQVP